MILASVTLTGADDSINPAALAGLSMEFPYVEWGILYGSRTRPRYPSRPWIDDLRAVAKENLHGANMRLSAHLCSGWVRSFVLEGKYTFGQHNDDSMYRRIQLNFHAHHHPGSPEFLAALRAVKDKQFIFQMDEVNDDLWKSAHEAEIQAVPLFDTSGGAGILPGTWPEPYQHVYCGYAGGLGPENLESQLRAIANVVPGPVPIWIDMETKVRSKDDEVFDLDKCRKVLEIAAPFIGRRV